MINLPIKYYIFIPTFIKKKKEKNKHLRFFQFLFFIFKRKSYII